MSRGGPQFQMTVPMTPAVKGLLIVSVGYWFVVQILLEGFILKAPVLSQFLALTPEQTIFGFYFWQPLTYIFLHSSQVTHVLFNMLMLWFFGAELEQRWGSKFFLGYFLGSGVGAALIYLVGITVAQALRWTESGMLIPVMGASGSVFGLLLAHGLIFGERIIHFFMIFPMKAKFFVMIMGFIELANLITSQERGSDVAYLAHLGGIASGFLILKTWGYIQRRQWGMKQMEKAKNRSKLRLVVDNEDSNKDGGPKYWN